MPGIFIVEGLTDATFFQELLARLFLQQAQVEYGEQPGRRNIPTAVGGTDPDGTFVQVEFRNQEGKAAIPAVIRGLLDEEVSRFTVALDIDDREPDQTVQSMHQVVYSHLGMTAPAESLQDRRIVVAGRVIDVIPMGLHQDGTLSVLGITSHALEDYLVKLILEDPSLRRNAPELHTLLHQVLPAIREHQGPFVSSKEVFQLIKPVVQHSFSDTGVVQTLLREADISILGSVLSPLLGDVKRALTV